MTEPRPGGECAYRIGVDVGDAAVGVYRIATARIAEAIGTVTIERGSDPRERNPALVAEDLGNGYVTEAGVEAACGFRANPER